MKDSRVTVCFPVDTALKFQGEIKGFYRGLLQAMQQVMVLALKRWAGALPHQGLSCLLGGLGTHKVGENNSVDELLKRLCKAAESQANS